MTPCASMDVSLKFNKTIEAHTLYLSSYLVRAGI
jgi:hypothetical protein